MIDSDLKIGTWYEAIDKYGSEEKPWSNYFFEIGDTVKYIQVEPDFKDSHYIEEDPDIFEADILENFEFEKTEMTDRLLHEIIKHLKSESNKNKREIIKGFLVS
jgi:hypothetical protein